MEPEQHIKKQRISYLFMAFLAKAKIEINLFRDWKPDPFFKT
jgi:hypothetical protein